MKPRQASFEVFNQNKRNELQSCHLETETASATSLLKLDHVLSLASSLAAGRDFAGFPIHEI